MKNLQTVAALAVISTSFAFIEPAMGQVLNPNVTKAPLTMNRTPLKIVCADVDLAITNVTLTKLPDVGRQQDIYTITYQIKNLGRDQWISGGNQVGAIMKITSTDVPNPGYWDTPITSDGGYNNVVSTFSVSMFGGERSRNSRNPTRRTLEIEITFGPDILNDGNKCNDDKSAPNNKFRIDAELDDFLRGPLQTKTFTQWGPD